MASATAAISSVFSAPELERTSRFSSSFLRFCVVHYSTVGACAQITMSDSSERRTTFSVSKALSGMSPKKSGFRATDLETGMSMEVIEVEAPILLVIFVGGRRADHQSAARKGLRGAARAVHADAEPRDGGRGEGVGGDDNVLWCGL